MRIDFKKIKCSKKNFFLSKIYDYIIIGSGPAAVTFIKLIIKNKINKNILVIEEGNFNKHNFKKVFKKYKN